MAETGSSELVEVYGSELDDDWDELLATFFMTVDEINREDAKAREEEEDSRKRQEELRASGRNDLLTEEGGGGRWKGKGRAEQPKE